MPPSAALVDSVTKPEEVAGDPNADVVDKITGRKNEGGPSIGEAGPSKIGNDKPAATSTYKPRGNVKNNEDILPDAPADDAKKGGKKK